MNSEILSRVIELAAEQVGMKVEEVSAASHFVNDLNFDSLDRVDFAMKLEEEFEMGVADEEAEKFQTVGQVAELIERERANARA